MMEESPVVYAILGVTIILCLGVCVVSGVRQWKERKK